MAFVWLMLAGISRGEMQAVACGWQKARERLMRRWSKEGEATSPDSSFCSTRTGSRQSKMESIEAAVHPRWCSLRLRCWNLTVARRRCRMDCWDAVAEFLGEEDSCRGSATIWGQDAAARFLAARMIRHWFPPEEQRITPAQELFEGL